MSFHCKLCSKVLPSRSGIWNHLKNKHKEQFTNGQDEKGKGQKRRQNLDEFISWKDSIKPFKSSLGRPLDQSIELTKKIREKSEIQNEDISLRTLTNNYMISILREISLLQPEIQSKYLRNPMNYASEKNNKIPITEKDSIKDKKCKEFLNRLLDFFTTEFNQKLINYMKEPSETIQESDQFFKLTLKNAFEYSD